MNFKEVHSRTDLTVEQLERYRREVIRDRSFPRQWKPIEVEYIDRLIAYIERKK